MIHITKHNSDTQYPEVYYRFDMEPLMGTLRSPIVYVNMNVDHASSTSIQKHLVKQSVRIRGGAPMIQNEHDIKYLTNRNFQYHGFPMIDFREKIMIPLNIGLASVSVSGWTLLSKAEDRDAAGNLGTPPRAGASAQQIVESDQRNERLFGVILNYIAEGWLYRHLVRYFAGDGLSVYIFLPQYGNLALPQYIITAREAHWNDMTMEKLRFPFSGIGYWKWLDAVLIQGERLNKSAMQIRQKFVDGLPSFFTSIGSSITKDNTLVIAATFGAHPVFTYPAAIRTTATLHPGGPDTARLAHKYFEDFLKACATHSREVPSGAVYVIEEDFAGSICHESEDQVNLLASDVTPATRCNLCGGDSHGTSQFLPNGEKLYCAKFTLNNLKAKKDEPAKIDDKVRSRYVHYKAKSADQAKQILELREQLSETNTAMNVLQAQHSRAQGSASAFAADTSNTNESDDDLHDDASQSSVASEINAADFADAVQKGKSKSKRR